MAAATALTGRFVAAHPRSLSAAVMLSLAGFGVTAFGIAPMAPDASELPKRLVTESVTPDGIQSQLDALAEHELQLYRTTADAGSGYTTVLGGDRFPYHGRFVPGNANAIGFEDLVVIEDYEFCRAVADGRPFSPGFGDAVDVVSVQAALLRSVASGRWEDVTSLRED